jgi:Fe2+ transport system protein FeoA
VRKDNTLSELKQIVSDLIKVPSAEFVLKRNMVQREFKNMSAKLSELGLSNGNLIKVEKGKPHQDGVYEVKIN